MSIARIAGLAAAIGTTGLGAAAHAQTEIPFWYGLTGQLSEAVQQVCDRFNDSQSDYRIACTSQGEYDQALQTAIAAYRAGRQPAILQVYEVGTLDMMLSGAIYPAHELMADMGIEIDWSDYIESIGHMYATAEGEMMSFPFNSSTPMLYVNTGLLRDAGIDAVPQTWEEAETALRAVHDQGGACPWAYYFDSWYDLEQLSFVHGVPVATRDNGYEGLDAEYVFNTTIVVDYAENLKAWYDEGLVRLFPNSGNARDAFSAGDCAIMMASIASHGTVTRDQAEGLEWEVAMLPVFEGTERMNSVVGGASLWVFQGHDEDVYRGAAAFFDFIRTPENQQYWSTITGYIPVTDSAFEAMVEAGFYEDPALAGRMTAIDSLRYTPVSPLTRGLRLGSIVQLRAILKEEMEQMLAGDKSPQLALDEAVRRGNELLRRFEQTYAAN